MGGKGKSWGERNQRWRSSDSSNKIVITRCGEHPKVQKFFPSSRTESVRMRVSWTVVGDFPDPDLVHMVEELSHVQNHSDNPRGIFLQ